MPIYNIFKKSLILCLSLSLILGPKAFAFDCLAPKITIEQSAVKQDLDKQMFLRDVIKNNLSFILVGACRTYSINLAALLFIAGIESWIVVNENHVWVETDEYILDAYMSSNFKLRRLEDLESDVYAQWKNSGGVIPKQSNLAKRFYSGIAVKIDDSEFNEMLKNANPMHRGFVPIKREYVPAFVNLRVTNAVCQAIDEQSKEKYARDTLIPIPREITQGNILNRHSIAVNNLKIFEVSI